MAEFPSKKSNGRIEELDGNAVTAIRLLALTGFRRSELLFLR